jgi:DNA-binding transcriptional LysR family regulator
MSWQDASMDAPDLNLLATLDVLLAEGNVARAAERLRLSPSAMSRQLARLRVATGDPLLVRAGRGLVPTPHALELRERVAPVIEEATRMLRPADARPEGLARSFRLRCSDGFVETFGPALLARIEQEAPQVRLRFQSKPDKFSDGLREGSIDLETGVLGPDIAPEVMSRLLFQDRYVAVVRRGHPLARGRLTLRRYGAARHVLALRAGQEAGPVDRALEGLGITRDMAMVVGGFGPALAIARGTDLVATVPERHTAGLRDGMTALPLPFAMPPLHVAMLWHPRMDADPGQRWLRATVLATCAAQSARLR